MGEESLETIEEYRALIHSYHQVGVGGLSTIKENNNMHDHISTIRNELNIIICKIINVLHVLLSL